MINSVSHNSQIPFAVRFNQASNSLVRASGNREIDPVAPSLPENPSRPAPDRPQFSPEERNDFRNNLNEALADFQQGRADAEQAKRNAALGINQHQHQQNMRDIYLTIAADAESSDSVINYSDLKDLSQSVKLNQLANSEADFEAIQSRREALEQRFEEVVRPAPEPYFQIQA